MSDQYPDLNAQNSPSSMKKAIVLIGIIILAITVIISHLGHNALYKGQLTASVLFPTSVGVASSKLSSDLSAAGEDKAAETLALRALNSSLMHVPAMRVLGMNRFKSGDTENGNRLMELASQQSWRDSPTHAWLLEKSLISGNYAASIEHADSLLRRRRAQNEIFNIFTLAMDEKTIAPAVIDKFATNPGWRPNFFSYAKDMEESQHAGFEKISLDLLKSKSPVTREEINSYANSLITRGYDKRALTLWSQLFPKDSNLLAKGGSLSLQWPKGDRIEKPYPIDWRFSESRSIFALVENNIANDAAILDLEMDRGAVGEIAYRPIIMANGKIQLSVTDSETDSAILSKLRWKLKCNDKKGTEIPFSQSSDGNLSWMAVINQSCGLYILSMNNPAGGLSRQTRIRMDSPVIKHIP